MMGFGYEEIAENNCRYHLGNSNIFRLKKLPYLQVQLSEGQNSCDTHLVSPIFSFNVIVGSFSIYHHPHSRAPLYKMLWIFIPLHFINVHHNTN